MYCAVDSRFQTRADMVILARASGLISRDLKYAFQKVGTTFLQGPPDILQADYPMQLVG